MHKSDSISVALNILTGDRSDNPQTDGGEQKPSGVYTTVTVCDRSIIAGFRSTAFASSQRVAKLH